MKTILKTIISPDLYGCKTWCLALREEYRLRVFENRLLRRIFRPKMDEVTGDSRKLRSHQLHDLYYSPDIIRMIKSRKMRLTTLVIRMGDKKNSYRILVGKPKETTRKT
jgi:hypothetical protein